MLQNVLRNLFSRPATRLFPKTRREPPSDARGAVVFDSEKCIFCGACSMRCPTGAIEVDRQARTVTFDLFRCVACACCAEACRKGCVQMRAAYHAPVYTKPKTHFQGAPVPQEEDG